MAYLVCTRSSGSHFDHAALNGPGLSWIRVLKSIIGYKITSRQDKLGHFQATACDRPISWTQNTSPFTPSCPICWLSKPLGQGRLSDICQVSSHHANFFFTELASRIHRGHVSSPNYDRLVRTTDIASWIICKQHARDQKKAELIDTVGLPCDAASTQAIVPQDTKHEYHAMAINSLILLI